MSINTIKNLLITLSIVFIFSACSPFNRYEGSTDFNSLTKALVEQSHKKNKNNLYEQEIILVSDFVNLSNLQNPSKLGFLLTDSIKNNLSSKNIIIRQVEFGKDFTIGKHGFNMLTRDQTRINKNIVNVASYALVGTYMITNKKLIMFVKLIDVQTGYILSSSSVQTVLTKEIVDLEKAPKNNYIYQPLVL